jgi:hypothetical protein
VGERGRTVLGKDITSFSASTTAARDSCLGRCGQGRWEGGIAAPFQATTPVSPSITRSALARRVTAVFDH